MNHIRAYRLDIDQNADCSSLARSAANPDFESVRALGRARE
jgi:hypothetical protein